MALSQANLKAALKAFADSISSGSPTTTDAAADALATAIHNYTSAAQVNIAIGAIAIATAPGTNAAPVIGTLS